MMTRQRPLRRLGLTFVAASAAAMLAVPAFAAGTPAPASLRDTVVMGSQVSTVLTLPATVGPDTITAGSVRVSLGGRPITATVTPVQHESRSAFIVIDTSGSMGAPGMAAAGQAARAYLAVVPADVRVGLLTFSDTVHLLVAPTQDRTAVARMLPPPDSQR
jgi:tight adherence protein B